MNDDGAGAKKQSDGDQRVKRQVMRAFDSSKDMPPGNQSVSSMPIEPGILFEQALEQTRMAVALADPHAPDCPLVFVNQAFETLTGYGRQEVIGRNCRFLQTERTSRLELDRMRRAMAREEVVVVELENQRKDGSTFMNALHVGPIYDGKGRLTHFYGSQWDVSELVEKRAEVIERRVIARELEHRISNLFAVISSIVRLSGRGETDVDVALGRANERILALARAHQATSHATADGKGASLHELVETVVKPYRLNVAGRFVIGGPPVDLAANAVTPLGLTLHELATNAVKYGALRHASGRVSIEWENGGDELKLVWDEGSSEPLSPERPGKVPGEGTGMRILDGVLAGVGATIAFHWREHGVKVVIAMPLAS